MSNEFCRAYKPPVDATKTWHCEDSQPKVVDSDLHTILEEGKNRRFYFVVGTGLQFTQYCPADCFGRAKQYAISRLFVPLQFLRLLSIHWSRLAPGGVG